MKKFILFLGFILFLSLSFTGCNDENANAQEDEDSSADVIIAANSGEILENPDGEGFILLLEVSPITVVMEESPGNQVASVLTEFFLESFNEIFGGVSPNAILSFNSEDGTSVALALKLQSVIYDPTVDVAEFLVTPLENVDDPGNALPLELIDVVESTIPQAILFIDSFDTADGSWEDGCSAFSINICDT